MIMTTNCDMQEFWSIVKKKMQNQMSKPMYDTWISQTVGDIAEGNTLIIKVTSKFAKEWIMQKYEYDFIAVLQELTGHDFEVQIIYDEIKADTGETKCSPIPKEGIELNKNINKVKVKRVSVGVPNITPSNYKINLRKKNEKIIRSVK